MKRPLFFLLLVWILGECAAVLLGIPLVPMTSLDTRMETEDTVSVRVFGLVRQIRRTSSGYSYLLTDTSVLMDDTRYRSRGILVYTDEPDDLKIGYRMETAGKLSAFELPGNPGQFDLHAYYRSQGIDYRLKETARTPVERSVRPLSQALFEWKIRLEDVLFRLADPEDAGVMTAMLLGDRAFLEEEIRADYQMASISHLLSISGLHVSLIGMALARLLKRAGLPAWLQLAVCAAVMGAYVHMTGDGGSAVRALVMFSLYLGAQAAGRTYDILSALSTAGLLLLWKYPLLLFQSGFQLSFLAVFGAGGIWPVVSEWIGEAPPWISGAGVSLTIQWMTWPVLAGMNGMIVPYGIAVNLAAVPLAGPLLILSGAAAAAGAFGCPLASLSLFPARGILSFWRMLSRTVVKLPGHAWVTGCPEKWQTGCYYLFLAGVLAAMRFRCGRKKKRKAGRGEPESVREVLRRCRTASGKILVLCAVSLVLLLSLHRLPVRSLSVMCLDVGQGDSILIRNPRGCCLIDAGSSDTEDVGRYRILPCLRSQAVSRLDLLILTHADGDHMNAMEELLGDSALSVGCLVLSEASAADPALERLAACAAEKGIPVRILRAGDSWTLGEDRFTCVYPSDAETRRFAASDINETSLVIRLDGRDFSALFTGDLGEEGERLLLQRARPDPVDVLKVGHHGSRFSSGAEFLEALRPSWGLISCGEKNRYGHPHPEALSRLEECGCRAAATKDFGALTVTKAGGELRVFGFRKKKAAPGAGTAENSVGGKPPESGPDSVG